MLNSNDPVHLGQAGYMPGDNPAAGDYATRQPKCVECGVNPPFPHDDQCEECLIRMYQEDRAEFESAKANPNCQDHPWVQLFDKVERRPVVDCSLPTATIQVTQELKNALTVANIDMVLAEKPAGMIRAIEELRRQIDVQTRGPSTAGLNPVMASFIAPFLKAQK